MFLTPDELLELTGLRRPSAQIRWLRSRHIRHYVNAAGHPVIVRAWLMGHAEPTPLPTRPDLRVINGRG